MATTPPASPPNNNPSGDPVWNSDGSVPDVSKFFSAPYFVGAGDPVAVGTAWYSCMKKYSSIDLTSIQSVWDNGYDIYSRLTSNDPSTQMPPGEPWPPEIIEQFRIWYNQGGRSSVTDTNPGSFGTPTTPIAPPAATRDVVVPETPVWSAGDPTIDDVSMCFTNPCWIQNGQGAAAGWQKRMSQFQYPPSTSPFDLQSYGDVSGMAKEIYYHVVSQSMPPYEPYFSPQACEMVRLWYNAGCPQQLSDISTATPPPPDMQIPPLQTGGAGASLPNKPFLMRKDINTLSDQELTAYREALLKVGAMELNSTWQTGGFLHANWCLHYMQASFPWHRAHLLWLEQQLGVPIPYWNFYSSKATDTTSADSGIPQAFLDESFIDSTGVKQKNPLLCAFARNGSSRILNPPTVEVQRATSFVTGRDAYISTWTQKYLDQIWQATQATTITAAGTNAFILNLSSFNDLRTDNDSPVNDPDSGQPFYGSDFDGLLELAHDNLHGWVGVDMANNSYAAFDPIFWSFHANFDRIFETWIRKNNPTNWSATPLRPFFLSSNFNVTANEDASSGFTTTLDMVQKCTLLGYAYGPTNNDDYVPSSSNINLARLPTAVAPNAVPTVVFPNTKCTAKTYFIHVGLDNGDGKKLIVDEPGYIGTVARLGMGPNNGNDRCIKDGIVRKLDASKAVNETGGIKENSNVKLKMLVFEDVPGQPSRELPESEYNKLPGFEPVFVWGPSSGGITNLSK